MSTTIETSAQIVKASQMGQVVDRIYELREPLWRADYEKALAAYQTARGDAPEVAGSWTEEKSHLRCTYKGTGYYELIDGKPVFHPRPELNRPKAYGHSRYYRIGDYSSKAHDYGLLTSSLFNRDIRPDRVQAYADAMGRGEWQTLLSDPIAITADGQVVNGQHRIAAACQVTGWGEDGEPDPEFLVIWGVDPAEAVLADGSHRTDRDKAVILAKAIGAA